MRRDIAGALVDAVILQPKVGGIGFDLKKPFGGGWPYSQSAYVNRAHVQGTKMFVADSCVLRSWLITWP